jgi:hypothetical protein
MSGPITPADLQKAKNKNIPEEVFEVFNDLIAEDWNGYIATVLEKDAAKRIARSLKITTTLVYKRHFLGIENAYREAGWKVKYDKPSYCDDYEPFFTFKKS